MSKVVLSIHPKYADLILNGEKKYEYRKRLFSKNVTTLILYATYPVKQVVGEVQIINVLKDKKHIIWERTHQFGKVTKYEYNKYYNKYAMAVAFELGNAIKYDVPKKLQDFNINKSPQSFVYLKEE